MTDFDHKFLKDYGFDEAGFQTRRAQVASGTRTKESSVVRGHIEPPWPGDVTELQGTDTPEGRRLLKLGQNALKRGELAVVVVAGGMATRFGGGAKGVVDVLEGQSFLGLEVRDGALAAHKYGQPVPLGIMTSFATHDAISEHLTVRKLSGPNVHLFKQGVSMRLTPTGDIFTDQNGKPSYYAPGHGEFFAAIKRSGLLDTWAAVKTIFFKNVDNKAATINDDEFAKVLGVHLDSQKDMTAEVVAKEPGDAGGVVARVDGRFRGVEGFRLVGDQSRFTDFSPNNLYFQTSALRRDIHLEHHSVEKTVDGRTAVQLEQVTFEASGDPSVSFGAVRVPRSRFLPVKEPADMVKLVAALKGQLGARYGLV